MLTTPALLLAQYIKGHAEAKCINIWYYYIQECIKLGEINVIHISASQNLADLFTKHLGCISHSHPVGLLGLNQQLESRGVLE